MLNASDAAVIRTSAALAARSENGLTHALEEAARVADPVHVEESLLQSYLFLGYPAALNGFAAWRSISGLAAPDSVNDPEDQSWAERGAGVCRTVYGGQYQRLKANVRRLHPDMEEWMIAEGYGRVLGRPGMPLELRELCIVAMLAVQDQPRQLYSHLRGALHAGAGREKIEATLSLACAQATPAAAVRARTVWKTVRERSGSPGPGSNE